MDRFDRIFKLHTLLGEARYPVPRARLMEQMECFRATLARIIQAMRLYLGAPFELRVPYSDPRQLAMDILKYGPDVEVLAPGSLRADVVKRLHVAGRRYARTRPESVTAQKRGASTAETVDG